MILVKQISSLGCKNVFRYVFVTLHAYRVITCHVIYLFIFFEKMIIKRLFSKSEKHKKCDLRLIWYAYVL